MGYLLHDNRVAGGEKLEYDTVACRHCRAVIKIVISGVTSAYATKFRCDRCRGPICRACASNMELTGKCNPFLGRVEHALAVGAWDEAYQFEYKVLPS